ncbi:MAG: DUF6440 family protein [Dehalococcoidia bacterium]|nr:DUF6440 family protein [Dehalococcoidia bacterium]
MADKRFVTSYERGAINILTDTKTGVQYLFVNALSNGCALTVLVDKSGKPMVDESTIAYTG